MYPDNANQPVYTPLTDPSRKRQRFAVGILIVAFVGLIMVGVANVVSNQNSISKDYTALAADHNELIRILDDHKKKARSLDTASYIARAEILLASDKNDFRDFLTERFGVAVTELEQQMATDNEVDDQLETADIANRFDDDFATIFGQKVDSAERQAQTLRDGASTDLAIEMLDKLLATYESLEL